MLSDVLLNLDCAAPGLGLVPWDVPPACGLSLFGKLIENSAVCRKRIEFFSKCVCEPLNRMERHFITSYKPSIPATVALVFAVMLLQETKSLKHVRVYLLNVPAGEARCFLLVSAETLEAGVIFHILWQRLIFNYG